LLPPPPPKNYKISSAFSYNFKLALTEYSEPEIGWIGEASQGLLWLGKQLEQDADQPPLPAPPVWTDSKLRRREALKKLAQGQKLSHDSHSQSQGMMGY
ncbi:MAG: hypothetical protein K2P37_07700, partial [Oscillospiraceae bacterium]|nr:hypothetical protein [Oscillospiraceae bacterium]